MKHLWKTLAVLGAAAFGLLACSTPATALDATADTWLNVREGPSALFEVVDTLAPGEEVSIEECGIDGWCRIEHPGPDGWINSDYVTPVEDGAGGGGAIGGLGDDCQFRITIGPGGPSLSITCGDGDGGSGGVMPGGSDDDDDDDGDDPAADPNRVCFYDGANFTDESICRSVGMYPNLGVANDRITSVRLYGTAKVRLCDRINMGPFCRDVTASEGQLGPYLDNQVSSLRVYTGSLPPLRQACFFDGDNYTGDVYCLRVGTRNNLGPWDDRVQSVAVFAGASVTLCYDAGMGPLPDGCFSSSTNLPTILPPFDPGTYGISSVRVQ